MGMIPLTRASRIAENKLLWKFYDTTIFMIDRLNEYGRAGTNRNKTAFKEAEAAFVEVEKELEQFIQRRKTGKWPDEEEPVIL